MPGTRRLLDLRGVGPSIATDLHQLGIFTVDQLAQSDGRELYDRLCALTGVRQDPCVEDTFVCAVAQARNPGLPAEQRNWWYWSRLRKRGVPQPRHSSAL
jgi:predicted RecB family nuclease